MMLHWPDHYCSSVPVQSTRTLIQSQPFRALLRSKKMQVCHILQKNAKSLAFGKIWVSSHVFANLRYPPGKCICVLHTWLEAHRALEHQRETLSISHCKKIRAKKRGRERKKSQVKRSKDKRALLLRKSTLIYSQLSLQTTFSFFHVKLVDVFVVANSKVRVWNWASDREQRRIFTSLISSKNWAHILALTVKGTSGETGKWTWM